MHFCIKRDIHLHKKQKVSPNNYITTTFWKAYISGLEIGFSLGFALFFSVASLLKFSREMCLLMCTFS